MIKKGQSNFFKKDTILDFKNIKIESEDKINKAFNNGNFTYIGNLEKKILMKINTVIQNAETLSPKIKKILLCT